MKTEFLQIVVEIDGIRLDKYLSTIEEIQSRNKALYLIENNLVHVNNLQAKPSYLCKKNDVISINLPIEKKNSDLIKYDFELDIRFEDDDLIVVNKPAGLVVHPSAGHEADTLVNALLNHTSELSMRFGEERPGIVHRIDKDTSGLLVVAKNDFTHQFLTDQFKEKTTHRIYEAICFGSILKNGTIQSFLARHPIHRKKNASLKDSSGKIIRNFIEGNEKGKWSVTHFKNISTSHQLSRVELKLETGRTHQIRVHLSEIGHPIIGDILYGADKKVNTIKSKTIQSGLKELKRFFLHAKSLGFKHPRSGEYLEYNVEWPKEDQRFIHELGL